MFSGCCVCESKNKPQDADTLPAGADSVPREDDPVIVMEEPRVQQQSLAAAPYSVNNNNGVEGTDEESLSAEERAVEKERMIQLVRQFVRDSRKGLQCNLFDSGAGTQTPGFLTLSRENGVLVLNGLSSGKVQLAHIADATLFEEIVQPSAQLSADLAARCARVLSIPSGMGEFESYIVFDEKVDAERFVTCLQILRMYADNGVG